MSHLIFYCPHCQKVLVGENYHTTEQPRCPHCHGSTRSTGYTKEEWVTLTPEEQAAMADTLTTSDTAQEDESMYANIGGKIKVLAKWMVIIESIAVVIGAILFAVEDQDMLLYSLLAIIIGPLVAWISSWLLYAFGELVEKTVNNEKNTRAILQLMLENQDRNDT